MNLQPYRVSRHSIVPVSSEIAILIPDGVDDYIVFKRAEVDAEIAGLVNDHNLKDITIAELREREAEHDASFQLRWNADMRAIKRWQAATGRDMTWPDHADLVVWLLERLEALEPKP